MDNFEIRGKDGSFHTPKTCQNLKNWQTSCTTNMGDLGKAPFKLKEGYMFTLRGQGPYSDRTFIDWPARKGFANKVPSGVRTSYMPGVFY